LKFMGIDRTLMRNILWLFSLQGLNYLIPLAVLPFLVRVLGIEKYGLVAFAQAFAQYFVILTDYGFNLSATKRIAMIRDDRERVSNVFWCVIILKVLFMLGGMLILVLLVISVPRFRSEPMLYAAAYLAVIGTVLFPVWLFQGMEQMKYISIVTGGAKLASALALFIFVRHGSDYVPAMAILSGGTLAAGLVGFVVALRTFAIIPRLPALDDLRDTLRNGWHLFVSTAATSFYTNSNLFLVGVIAGNVQAGYFSAAEKIIRGMQAMLVPITQAIYPHVNNLMGRSHELALAFLRKGFVWISVLSFVPSALLLLCAAPVAHLVVGPNAGPCIPLFRWMAMLPFIIAISNVLGIQTMIPFGMERELSRIYVVAGLASLPISIILIRQYGALGAAVSVLTVELAIIVCMWAALKNRGLNLLYFGAVSASSTT
jgi:polysaccharide transporter, PST family